MLPKNNMMPLILAYSIVNLVGDKGKQGILFETNWTKADGLLYESKSKRDIWNNNNKSGKYRGPQRKFVLTVFYLYLHKVEVAKIVLSTHF